jgi:hypothetical protein
MAGEEAMRAVEAIRPRRLELPVVARRPTGHQFVCLSLAAPTWDRFKKASPNASSED